jgi:nitroimidazol reductase NimA-like FMN-containing flavoprotein (pyridoxamine 5'-phosphate oxidase superfamily)
MWDGMWIDQRGSHVVERPECARLLALGSGGVGRIGLVVEGQPVIVPLNYRIVDGDVVVRVGPGTILATIRDGGAIVAFEVDHTPVGDDSVWWSVLVQGLARTVTDPERVASLRAKTPIPAIPEPGEVFVRIRTEVLSGRRFAPRKAGDDIRSEATSR